jgi:hypothetical protein
VQGTVLAAVKTKLSPSDASQGVESFAICDSRDDCPRQHFQEHTKLIAFFCKVIFK